MEVNPHVTQSAVHIHGSPVSADSTNHESRGTLFTTEEYLHIHGPVPVKPVLFKG